MKSNRLIRPQASALVATHQHEEVLDGGPYAQQEDREEYAPTLPGAPGSSAKEEGPADRLN